MNKHTLFAAFAVVGLTAAVPTVAALHPMGSVEFSLRDRHDARLGNFKAASVALIARGSDVMCDRVVATYGNGRRGEIFRGQLPEGQQVRVNLDNPSVDRVDFDCRPTDRDRARIEIAAEDGRGSYREDRYDRRYQEDRYDQNNRRGDYERGYSGGGRYDGDPTDNRY